MWKWALIAVLVVLIVLSLIVASGVTWGPEIPFHSETWKGLSLQHRYGVLWSRKPGGDNRRARMVGDLLTHHLHAGLTWSEAQAILGDEDAGGDGHSYYGLLHEPRLDQLLVSWLRWRTTEPELVVEFSSGTGSGRLVHAEVIRY